MLVATTDPWQTGRVHRVWPLIVAGVLAVVAATASHAGKPALVLVRGKEGAVLVSPAGYALDCTVDKGTIEVGMACTLRDGSGHVVEKSYVVGIGSDNSVSLGQIRAGVFTPINKWKGRGPKTPAFGRFVKDPIARVVGVRLGRFYGFSGTSARCTVPTIPSSPTSSASRSSSSTRRGNPASCSQSGTATKSSLQNEPCVAGPR